MRLAYRARELFADGSASDVVLKRFKSDTLEEGEDEAELIAAEAMTQAVADDYAQQFNKLCAAKGMPHCIAFAPVSVVRIPASARDGTRGEETYSIEPFIPGEYVKYSKCWCRQLNARAIVGCRPRTSASADSIERCHLGCSAAALLHQQ